MRDWEVVEKWHGGFRFSYDGGYASVFVYGDR